MKNTMIDNTMIDWRLGVRRMHLSIQATEISLSLSLSLSLSNPSQWMLRAKSLATSAVLSVDPLL
jgi:hypothetical protein